MEEEFRTIPRCENYEITCNGVVRNKKTGSVLSKIRGKNYILYQLSRNGHKYTKPIQYFVALAWIPNPYKYPYAVRKINDIKNNHYSNIAWSLGKRSWTTNNGSMCASCKKFLPLKMFAKDRCIPTGVSSSCKRCDNLNKRGTVCFSFEDNPEYVMVPGCSDYVVNKNGCVRKIVNNKKMKPTKSKHSYYFTLTSDIGDRKIYSVKNLLGDCFLPKVDGLKYVYHSGDDIHDISLKDLYWSMSYAALVTHDGRMCGSCNKFLSWDNFTNDSEKVMGKDSTCRECKSKKFSESVLYSTYAPQLTVDEDARESGEGVLEVRCSYCGEYFKPTLLQVTNRIGSLSGRCSGDHRFYDSEECTKLCSVYNQTKFLKNESPYYKSKYSDARDSEWVKMVLERDAYTCQKCGSKENVVAHHIVPIAENFMLSGDMSNGVCYCQKCHKESHSIDGCKLSDLAGLCR